MSWKLRAPGSKRCTQRNGSWQKSQKSHRKKVVWPSRRRERVQHAVAAKGISIRLACELFLFSQNCYRYDAKRNVGNEAVANWLTRLTDNKRNWGLCYLYLRSVKGFKWNHKCIIAFTVSLSRSAHQPQETWCVRNWKHWRFQRQSGLVDGFHAWPTGKWQEL